MSPDVPIFLKLPLTLVTIALIAAALYLGSSILVPLSFSVLLAMLLHPVVNFLHDHKLNRVVAILLSIFISLCLIGAVIFFLSKQIGNFLNDIPTLTARLRELLNEVKIWIQEHLNIDIREQNQYLSDTKEKMTDEGPAMVQRTVVTLTEVISYFVFLPVYTFLILYHKDTIKRFLAEFFRRRDDEKVTEVVEESQTICQQYLTGMLIELVIVFALNALGFIIVGIRYPIFLALTAALLNIVPYIGMLIANIFCMLITLVSTDDVTNVFWVAGVLGLVQVADNNILMPFIVGSKIKINAMAIILGVLIGGALCGVPGMFLAIPGLAVMKVIFERVESLRPWAILLGDETASRSFQRNPIKSAFTRLRRRNQST